MKVKNRNKNPYELQIRINNKPGRKIRKKKSPEEKNRKI